MKVNVVFKYLESGCVVVKYGGGPQQFDYRHYYSVPHKTHGFS